MTQEELINQNKVLESRLNRAKEVFRTMTAEQEALKQKVAELEKSGAADSKCDELASTVEALTEKLNAALEDSKKYVEEIHEKDLTITSLKETINSRDNEEISKNEKIAELSKRLENAKTAFADDKKRYNELAERFDKLTVEHKELKAQADDAVSERDNQIKSLEAALSTATTQSKKYIEEYGVLADQVLELTQKNDSLLTDTVEYKTHISDLEEEVRILKNKNTHLNEKLSDYTNKLPQIKENLTKEVEEMQVKTKKLQENLVSNFNIFG